MSATYQEFIREKSQIRNENGFEPLWIPDFLFDFQKHLVEWSIRKGRAAILADCGLGKTIMQLVWAENVVRKTNMPVLVVTPLAVSQQTLREAERFGIDAEVSRDGRFSKKVVITNYERLQHFDSSDFCGAVPDEAGILKNVSGSTRKRVTRFLSKMDYRLPCTATAAPNDYVELGSLSEALGELSHSDMLRRFFQQLDDKGQRKEQKQQQEAEFLIAKDPNYFKKLAYRVSQTIGQWRLRNHAVQHFWRWVASWARACRMPSDLGFSDDQFKLPPLHEHDHIIKPNSPPPGRLFNTPAIGLGEEREERKRTLKERCEYAANLVDHNQPAVLWCHTNQEADTLVSLIPGAEQVAGRTPDDLKVELYEAFASGELRAMVIKPKIGAWGLNWQHCNHVVTFASHSYEQYYQSTRRCWRFGQKRPVTLDVIATEGEVRVLENMRRKSQQASLMFDRLVGEMRDAESVARPNFYTKGMESPSWL